MTFQDSGARDGLPDWVPDAARHYLSHTESGLSIRALARARGVHASTILRQVRRIEMRRDDPLVDAAIQALAKTGILSEEPCRTITKGAMPNMKGTVQHDQGRAGSRPETDSESLRVLRRLAEPGAVLAVAPDMEKAVVVRETPDGRTLRSATLEREVAETMALRDWIEPLPPTGRVRRYRISSAGQTALRQATSGSVESATGFSEARAAFEAAGPGAGLSVNAPPDCGTRRPMVRYNAAESPVLALSRRREKDGTRFLSGELVAAAERLREDFELAQMGERIAQNWDRLLTGRIDGKAASADLPTHGPVAARARVDAALADLGPGLGDVVLRCCCFLEGLETTERRLGWSSRSGKIVLRIALQRLRRHYEATGGLYGVLIG